MRRVGARRSPHAAPADGGLRRDGEPMFVRARHRREDPCHGQRWHVRSVRGRAVPGRRFHRARFRSPRTRSGTRRSRQRAAEKRRAGRPDEVELMVYDRDFGGLNDFIGFCKINMAGVKVSDGDVVAPRANATMIRRRLKKPRRPKTTVRRAAKPTPSGVETPLKKPLLRRAGRRGRPPPPRVDQAGTDAQGPRRREVVRPEPREGAFDVLGGRARDAARSRLRPGSKPHTRRRSPAFPR